MKKGIKMKCILAAATMGMALSAPAELIINFTNQLSGVLDPGAIKLDFTVDGSGVVSLIASTTGAADQATEDAITAWSSPNVGTISWEGAWGTSFSIDFTATQGAIVRKLRISNTGTYGGLGIVGGAAGRIDQDGLEKLHANLTMDIGRLQLTAVRWENKTLTGNPNMVLTGALGSSANTLTTVSGLLDVSSQGIWAGNGQAISFGNKTFGDSVVRGYSLAGFTFDVIPPIPEPATVGLLACGFLLLRRLVMK